jgi:hypothetical protein
MDENIKDVLVGFTILGTLGITLVVFTRILTDYILKRNMINKGFVNDDTQAIFKRHAEENENKYSSLKWGLIFFFAGLSLVIMEYIPFGERSPLPYGLFTVAVSLGFLLYYFIAKKENKRS